MRVISRRTLREYWQQHPDAEEPLRAWERITGDADWRSFVDCRRDFPHADQVKLHSGTLVTVFNIGGNDHRLVCGIEYRKHLVFTFRVTTHAEYSKGKWKDHL